MALAYERGNCECRLNVRTGRRSDVLVTNRGKAAVLGGCDASTVDRWGWRECVQHRDPCTRHDDPAQTSTCRWQETYMASVGPVDRCHDHDGFDFNGCAYP